MRGRPRRPRSLRARSSCLCLYFLSFVVYSWRCLSLSCNDCANRNLLCINCCIFLDIFVPYYSFQPPSLIREECLIFDCLACEQVNPMIAAPSSGAAPQVQAATAAGCSSGNRDSGEYRFTMLRDRCASLEQELRAARGALAVLKSKQPRPTEREAYVVW